MCSEKICISNWFWSSRNSNVRINYNIAKTLYTHQREREKYTFEREYNISNYVYILIQTLNEDS